MQVHFYRGRLSIFWRYREGSKPSVYREFWRFTLCTPV